MRKVLPAGWDEIIRLKDQLEAPSSGFKRARYLVLPLHSMVPPADQRKVFVRPAARRAQDRAGHQHRRDSAHRITHHITFFSEQARWKINAAAKTVTALVGTPCQIMTITRAACA